MGNEVSSGPALGHRDLGGLLPPMVLFIDELVSPSRRRQMEPDFGWKEEELPTSLPFLAVFLDGEEAQGGRVVKFPSGPIEIRPRGVESRMQVRIYDMPIPEGFALGLGNATCLPSCAELSAPVHKLANYGAPLFTSLWLGLTNSQYKVDGEEIIEALQRARLPESRKMKIRLFRTAKLARQLTSGRRLRPDIKRLMMESDVSDQFCVEREGAASGISAVAQIEGLMRCLDESTDLVRTLLLREQASFERDKAAATAAANAAAQAAANASASTAANSARSDSQASLDVSHAQWARKVQLLQETLQTEYATGEARDAAFRQEIESLRSQVETAQQELQVASARDLGKQLQDAEDALKRTQEELKAAKEMADKARESTIRELSHSFASVETQRASEIAQLQEQISRLTKVVEEETVRHADDLRHTLDRTEQAHALEREQLEATRMNHRSMLTALEQQHETIAQSFQMAHSGEEKLRHEMLNERDEIWKTRLQEVEDALEATREDLAFERESALKAREERFVELTETLRCAEERRASEVCMLQQQIDRLTKVVENEAVKHTEDLRASLAKTEKAHALELEQVEQTNETQRAMLSVLERQHDSLAQKVQKFQSERHLGSDPDRLKPLEENWRRRLQEAEQDLKNCKDELRLEREKAAQTLEQRVTELNDKLKASETRREAEVATLQARLDQISQAMQDETVKHAKDMRDTMEKSQSAHSLELEKLNKIKTDREAEASKAQETAQETIEKLRKDYKESVQSCTTWRKRYEELTARMEYMSNKGTANPLESKVERTILKMFRCLVAERLTPIAEEDMDKLFEKFGLNGSDVSRADFGKDIRKAALATKEFEMRKLFKKFDVRSGKVSEHMFEAGLQHSLTLDRESLSLIFYLIDLSIRTNVTTATPRGKTRGGDGSVSEEDFVKLFSDRRLLVQG